MTELFAERSKPRSLDFLLVEDNPVDAELALLTLKKAGFEVRADTVQTAHEFCAQLAAKAYHVVVSDYTLPGWNGLEVLELLQQMEKEIPFILLTGTLGDESAAECLKK